MQQRCSKTEATCNKTQQNVASIKQHAVFCYSVGTDKHFLEMLRGNVKQTIEMDGGGMGRDFWQKYRIGKELLTEKKLFMCRRVQTNLANTRGIYSVGSALPRS